MDLWEACRAHARPAPLAGSLTRIVESQEQVATTALVGNLAEQALLEELLEAAKPPLRPGTAGLHYLLATPFRYPPLRHGSRFGSRFEPSLLYGSRECPAALAETAYYRFVFWQGMAEPPPAGRLLTQHTAFGAAYSTQRGLRLQAPPFDAHRDTLRDPAGYGATQALGTAMRAAGIEAFEYVSARDGNDGLNVALFVPGALASREPTFVQPWLCETRPEAVTFSTPGTSEPWRYPLEDFLVAGRLPRPAI